MTSKLGINIRSKVIEALSNWLRSDEGLTLETSACKISTLSTPWQYQITLLYSPTDAAPQFLQKLTSLSKFIHSLCKYFRSSDRSIHVKDSVNRLLGSVMGDHDRYIDDRLVEVKVTVLEGKSQKFSLKTDR